MRARPYCRATTQTLIEPLVDRVNKRARVYFEKNAFFSRDISVSTVERKEEQRQRESAQRAKRKIKANIKFLHPKVPHDTGIVAR